MNMMKTEKIAGKMTAYKICLIAFAICINFVGGQIALLLKLPIYLDSIGTVFVASILGPFYGMLPNLLSGLLMGMTVDVYSLYYAPVGIVLGFVTGLVYRKWQPKKWSILPAAVVITLLSSCITAFLFGGITSSGSSILVQILSKTPLGMVGSCFVVQFITDYADRVLCLAVSAVLITALNKSMKGSLVR